METVPVREPGTYTVPSWREPDEHTKHWATIAEPPSRMPALDHGKHHASTC
jgi:hypothetical protein